MVPLPGRGVPAVIRSRSEENISMDDLHINIAAQKSSEVAGGTAETGPLYYACKISKNTLFLVLFSYFLQSSALPAFLALHSGVAAWL